MLKKLDRKHVDKEDVQMPQSIEELIEFYGLNELWDYIDKIVDELNEREV